MGMRVAAFVRMRKRGTARYKARAKERKTVAVLPKMVFPVVLLVIATRFVAHGNPDGAPIEACSTLTPQHGANPQDCGVECPFTLTLQEIDSVPVTAVDSQLPMYTCGSQHKGEFSVSLHET